MLFGLSFWGDYVHLLGGATSLAPLYAFVVGVCLHHAAMESRRVPLPALIAILALAAFLACGLRKQTSLTILGEVISSGTLILLVATTTSVSMFAALDVWPVCFIGRISYSFYLLHLIGLAIAIRLSSSALAIAALTIIFTIPLAWTSWFFIERPCLRLRSSAKPRIPEVAAPVVQGR